jgi:hypothetical protein
MPTILIQIDPERLVDPDLDLRYEIPDLLIARAPDLFGDAGYDYSNSDHMQIFLSTKDLARALQFVLALLDRDRLHSNDLASASTVATSEVSAADAHEFRVVAPVEQRDAIIRRSGSPSRRTP